MKIKMIVAACALASTSAFAGGGALTFVGNTASFSESSTVSPVNDVYTFTLAAGTYLANGSLTSAALGTSDFDATSIVLKNTATLATYSFTQTAPDPFETWQLSTVAITGGSYTLTISGVNAAANGSYGGTLNVAVAAVPEPETYALMLAGLGVLGFVARRRRPQ